MFIIDITYNCTIEKIEEHLKSHIEYLDKYYEKKIFLCSGRKTPRTGGVILATNVTLNSLKKLIKEDPFVRFNLATVNITEFTPSKFTDGLESIINPLTTK